VVLAALRESSAALQYAAPELRADRKFLIRAIIHCDNGLPLKYAAEELHADRQVVFAAVSRNPEALQYASEELRADEGVVLAAISRNPEALQYAAPKVRADDDWGEIIYITRSCPEILMNAAAEELKCNCEVVLSAVRRRPRALKHAAEELKSNREVVLSAVRRSSRALKHAAEELKSDREVVLNAIRRNPRALRYAAEELKADREVVARAVRGCATALQYAAAELRDDEAVVLAHQTSRCREQVQDRDDRDFDRDCRGCVLICSECHSGPCCRHCVGVTCSCRQSCPSRESDYEDSEDEASMHESDYGDSEDEGDNELDHRQRDDSIDNGNDALSCCDGYSDDHEESNFGSDDHVRSDSDHDSGDSSSNEISELNVFNSWDNDSEYWERSELHCFGEVLAGQCRGRRKIYRHPARFTRFH